MPNKNRTKRAVLYARTATQPIKGEPSSLGEQMQRLRMLARQQGYQVVAEHQEVGSGAVRNRTQLDQVLSQASQHKFDVLVIDDLDRLSRRCDYLIETLTQLKETGIKLALVHPPGNVLNKETLAHISRVFRGFRLPPQ